MKNEAKTTLNTEQLGDYFGQIVKDETLLQSIRMLIEMIGKLTQRNDDLERQLFLLRNSIYGRKSEAVSSEQLSLFGDEPVSEPDEPVMKTPEPKEPTRPHGGGRRKISDQIPREDVIVPVVGSDRICPQCGMEKIVIGYETSETIEFIPSQIKVMVYKREKCACKACQDGVSVAPVPDKLIEKGLPGVGLITEILVNKYKDHLPVYRMHQRFKRMGIDIPQSTMTGWIGQITPEILKPIAELIRQEVIGSNYIQTDDTTIAVLDRTKEKNIIRGYYWFYIADGRHVSIDFTPGRGHDGPKEFLKNWHGEYLQSDGYPVYEVLSRERQDFIRVGCWMHARRYFHNAFVAKDIRVVPVLGWIKAMYKVEETARNDRLSPEAIRMLRQQETVPILADIRAFMDTMKAKEPPKSYLGKAIGYADGQWNALIRFAQDGRVSIDNGAVERAIRPVALGRKNYLFAGSEAGARNAAVIYSLMGSCELSGAPVDVYFRDVMEKISHGWPMRRLSELLPYEWKTRFFDQSQSPLIP